MNNNNIYTKKRNGFLNLSSIELDIYSHAIMPRINQILFLLLLVETFFFQFYANYFKQKYIGENLK